MKIQSIKGAGKAGDEKRKRRQSSFLDPAGNVLSPAGSLDMAVIEPENLSADVSL